MMIGQHPVDRRTLLMIAAFAVPLVILALVLHLRSSAPSNEVNLQKLDGRPTLAQEIMNVKTRMAQLQKMTPADWPQERKIHPHVQPTLQQALAWNKNRLSYLQSLTEAQWEAQRFIRLSGQQAAQPQRQPAQRSPLDIIPKPKTSQPLPSLPPTSR